MLFTIKKFVNSLNQSWLEFKRQTQLILLTLALILTTIITITFGSSTTLQQFPSPEHAKIVNDINFLVRDNIFLFLKEGKTEEIILFCERFYKKSGSIKYILYIDDHGTNYGVPYSYNEIFNQYDFLTQEKKLIKSNVISNLFNKENNILHSLTAFKTEKGSSFLLIGITPNLLLFSNFIILNQFIFLVTSIFVVIIILGIIFINITVTRPLNEVSQGLTNIANGNFLSRITVQTSGELGEIIGNYNEMSRRLQLYEEKNREQLKSERFKLESLITTITDGIILLDTNLQVVLINKTAIQIFGWKTRTKLIGTPIWENLPIILQKKLFVTLQDVLRKKQPAIFESKIENGLSSFPNQLIRVTVNIVYDSLDINKIPIGVGLTIQDRTREFEFDKTQNRFISNISHELRTPLFNIKSFIETIQEYDYTLSNWQKKYFLDIANKETNRLTRLVNDILCISKLNARNEIKIDKIALQTLLHLTIANYQIIARDKNLSLQAVSPKQTLYVYGNRDLLLQVLLNLVGNALKFTYKDGEIAIRVYTLQDKKVRIEIIDTGIGIIDRYQQYIFQRFYRVENEVHTLKGTGLGLSIVDTILAEHKTKIGVVSRYKVGSVFWFDLLTEEYKL